MLLHLPDNHTAEAVQDAIVEEMARLPPILRRTLTWDQGKEMANHAAIARAAELEIYFCDPHSPWQRPTNENTNGLLRQYFPKGTDLSVYPATTSSTSPPNSTTGPERAWAGEHPPKPSTGYSQPVQTIRCCIDALNPSRKGVP